MKIVKNNDFKKEFPPEMIDMMDDVTCFMEYDLAIQYSDDEEDLAVKIAKCLSTCGDSFDQLGKDSNGLRYYGLY